MPKLVSLLCVAALAYCTSGYIGPDVQAVDGDTSTGHGLFNRHCSSCHGADARGRIEVGSPNIRGKTAGQIQNALATVSLMQGLQSAVSAQDVEDIAAYLQTLAP